MLSNSMHVTSAILEVLGTPLADSALESIHAGGWVGLSSLEVLPSSYDSPLDYFQDAQVAALFKKRIDDSSTDSESRRKRCIEKWWDGERACFHTNERLSRYLPENSPFSDHTGPATALLAEARKMIRLWIGDSPADLAVGRHGPGATFHDKGRKSTVVHKFDNTTLGYTRGAIWWLPQLLGSSWGDCLTDRGKLVVVPGNRFTTVPKTALIDRAIAVEPAVNIFFQLSLGQSLRRRLKATTGWDLKKAAQIHRKRAELASVDGLFCTIDLSNASDTVARNLVKLLLPHGWYDQLNDLRSGRTFIDDRWVVLEKFSSMGNGFTFELESIIFAALSAAAGKLCGQPLQLGVDLFVFGDDIILPDALSRAVIAALRYCGFTTNVHKTFVGNSPFRESCGGDFMSGMDVRPIYWKSVTAVDEIVAMHNALFLLEDKFSKLGREISFARARERILESLPRSFRRCRGPRRLGNSTLWTEAWDSEERYVRVKDQIRLYPVIHGEPVDIVPYDRFGPSVQLACALYGASGSDIGGVIPRDPVRAFYTALSPCS